MANVMTGAGLISKIKADFGITLYPAVERAYATRLQAVIDANPTATDEALDSLLVNQLMKLSLVRNVLVQAFDENGDGKISSLSELNTAKGALDGTVDAAQADAAAGNVSTGQTFTLTTGTDNVTGTTGNDTIIGELGALATLNGSDQINGGSGVDTLKIYGGNTTPVGVSNVEIFNFVTPTNTDINVAAQAGLTKVVVSDASLLNGKTITTGNGVTLSLATAAGVNTAGKVTWAASNTDTSANLVLEGYQYKKGVVPADLDVTGTATTTLNIASTGNANKIGTLDTGAAVTKHVITGDKALSYALAAGDVPNLDSVNASAMTAGGANVNLSNGALKAAFTFTGGAGDDSIKLANDQLGVFTSGAQLDGGAGSGDKLGTLDTAFSAAEFAAINAAKGFEVLGINAANTLDASKLTSIKEFSLDADGIVTISNMVTGSKVAVTAAHASNVSLSSATGVNDLSLTIGTANTAGLTVGGTLTLGQTSVALASLGDGTGTNTITTLANADNSTITVTGNNDLNMGTLNTSAIGSKVDAAAFTGKLTVTGGNNSDILIGGSGVDTLNGGEIKAGVTGVTAVTEVQTIALGTLVDSVAYTLTLADGVTTLTTATSDANTTAAELLALITGNAGYAALPVTVALNPAGDSLVLTYETAAAVTGLAKLEATGYTTANATETTAGVTAVTAVTASMDTLTGNGGADIFAFSSADIDTTAGAVTAVITDFKTALDTIKVTNGANAGAGSATNYVEATSAAATLTALLAEADNALNGTVDYYVGQVGSDSYLVTDADGNGYTNVIKLTGVSLDQIAATDLIA